MKPPPPPFPSLPSLSFPPPPSYPIPSLTVLVQVEAKAKKSEFGVEKGLLQGQAGDGQLTPPETPEFPKVFQQNIFKGQKREAGGRVSDELRHNSLIG